MRALRLGLRAKGAHAPGAIVAMFAALLGCGNRAIDVKVDSLGPEVEGIEQGPYHRPGQPCILCHGYGGQEPTMVVAGTIFGTPAKGDTIGTNADWPKLWNIWDGGENEPIPVEGALVTITDSLGKVVTKETNCVGNFYIETSEEPLAFPLHAEIECKPGGWPQGSPGGCDVNDFTDGCDRQVMTTRIGRDGSCAGCHYGDRNQGSPGWIYCAPEQPSPPFARPTSECPGVP